jgi:hypothetical protein
VKLKERNQFGVKWFICNGDFGWLSCPTGGWVGDSGRVGNLTKRNQFGVKLFHCNTVGKCQRQVSAVADDRCGGTFADFPVNRRNGVSM